MIIFIQVSHFFQYFNLGGENMLPAIECLKMLIDKENGLGIPLKVAARFMDCHATTLGNYLHEGYTPSARLEK